MKRILFVDDEPHVLDGLRDMLRKQRKQWEMTFALGGAAAIEVLARAPFDVVVSDMRMPNMDGAALLAHVKEHYPTAARIILSGQSDRESAMRALSAAHQFLSKPCDSETLRLVVERACQLQQIMSNEAVRVIVGKLVRLPSPPQTYWDLTAAAARPESSLSDFAAIVERDPAMSVKVLQLVNSAYFGLAQRLTSVQQAVVRLGVDLLKALALSAHAFGTLKAQPVPGFSVEALQSHSLLTARVSKGFFSDPVRCGQVFAAAMMHDVGKLVLAEGAPERFAEIVQLHRATGRRFDQIERELLGVSHAEVGAYLLGYWGLPLALVEAVAFHHAPGEVPPEAAETLGALHIADALVDTAAAAGGSPPVDKLDMVFVERAGLTKKLPEWRKLAAAAVAAG